MSSSLFPLFSNYWKTLLKNGAVSGIFIELICETLWANLTIIFSNSVHLYRFNPFRFATSIEWIFLSHAFSETVSPSLFWCHRCYSSLEISACIFPEHRAKSYVNVMTCISTLEQRDLCYYHAKTFMIWVCLIRALSFLSAN